MNLNRNITKEIKIEIIMNHKKRMTNRKKTTERKNKKKITKRKNKKTI
jgi:hypothetical protein